jgi:lipopolysaccharide transport system permease protein
MTTKVNAEVQLNPPLNPKLTVIKRQSFVARVTDLIGYRELVTSLVVRELKARYKNSVLGFLWSLLNPLGMMLVFTVVFTVFWPDNQVDNYPVFLLCGLLPWNYFSAGIMGSIHSIVGNAGLVKKIYFPREILPIAAILAQLVNFLLALVVLFAVLLAFHANISSWVWVLPLVILIQTCFMLGMALILSTLNVFYRDVAMVMDVVMLAWFFLTPIFYPIERLPRSYELLGINLDVHWLMHVLNPMSSLISAYRDLLYWGYLTDIYFLSRTIITALLVLVFGYWFFVRFSGRFGEEV